MTRQFGDDTFGSGTFGGMSVGASGVVYSVEVAFSSALLDNPIGWTDITTYVRNFSTRRGRSHELGRMQAGEASLTLNNRDRRFDPTYTSSPYYPNVTPMRQCRIRATSASTTYDLFWGYVEDWGQQWSGPHASGMGDATCEVHLVDAFKVLNLIDLTSYRTEVLQDSPLGYWTFEEAALPGVLTNLGSDEVVMTLQLTGSAWGQMGPLAGGATAASADSVYVSPSDAGDAWKLKANATVEAWIYPDTAVDLDPVLVGTAAQYLRFSQEVGGALSWGTSGGGTVTSTGTVPNASWHHVAAVRVGSNILFYIDGVLDSTKNLVLPSATVNPQLTVLSAGSQAPAARVAHVAIYDYALSAERIAVHAGANIDLLVPSTADAAIGEVLDAIGWPSGLRSITTSSHVTSAHVPNANALTELLMLAEETDGGLLFAQGNGTLTFRSADDLRADVTSIASWGDSSAELKYSGLTLRYDDADLYTEVRASAQGLADAVASDPSAAVTYGDRSLETSAGVLGDANQLTDRATGYLDRYNAPALRPETLVAVDSVSQPSRTEELFASEIGRRVTVKRRPPGGGSTITIDSLIEGVSYSPVEQLTQCRGMLNLVPVLDPTPWLLEDATYGVLDTTTDLGW